MGENDLLRRSGVTAGYDTYQGRYRNAPRESDKVLLDLINNAIGGRVGIRLLDIGCSTGNLMQLIAEHFPQIELTGGDIAEDSLRIARSSMPHLNFRHMDVLDLAEEAAFDIIVANAVTYPFDDEEYQIALSGIAHTLRPGGTYLSFEWIHETDGQHIMITERTPAHRNGVPLHARPQDFVRAAAARAKLHDINFIPFFVPIDLRAQPRIDGVVATHTLELTTGDRISMRGAIYQPWCFLRAQAPVRTTSGRSSIGFPG